MTDHSAYFRHHWPLLQEAGLYWPSPNPTFRNPTFAEASGRVLIVRLSPFHDVERSTPHLVLSQFVRRALPSAYIDLAFLPPRHDRDRVSRAGIPLLVGSQSFRSLDEFDLVLVSNSYVLELINLPYLLLRSGVPPMASQRGEEWPPIVVGGSNATAAQAIVSEDGDCLADALFFGEGEDQLDPLVRALCRPGTKDARLSAACAAATGLWVAGPGAEQAVEPAIVSSPSLEHLLTQYPALNGPESQTARLQISYGCPAFCSFCFEGYDRKPYREVGREEVMAAARRLKLVQGCTSVDLHSFNFNTHSSILPLVGDLNRILDRVSLMSQRVDLLASTPDLLNVEVAAGKRHYTFGIEGISQRQRAWLHKSLSSVEIRTVLERIFKHHVRQIKLFYVLSGHESETDLAEFRAFVRWLKATRARLGTSPRLTFSFGRLVRMPFTPLRYDRLMLDRDDWTVIEGTVKSICETNGFEFRLATRWSEYCTSQVLAMGGHWMLDHLMALAQSGHCFDGELTPEYWDGFRTRIAQAGHWRQEFLGEKDQDYIFPMRFLRPRVPSSFLYSQYARAKEYEDQGYCLGSDDRAGQCLACGACQDGRQRASIVGHSTAPPPDRQYASRLSAMVREKRGLEPVFVRARLPMVYCGATVEWLNAAFLRRLLSLLPEIADDLISADEALFTTGPNCQRYPIFSGETVFALKSWDPVHLAAELSALADRDGLRTSSGRRVWRTDEAAGPPDQCASRTDSIVVLGPAQEFVPGRFKRASLTIRLPHEHFESGGGGRLVQFLRDSYVACNTRRVADRQVLELPKKAIKKKSVFGGEYRESQGWTVMQLIVGPKFDLGAFLASFGGRGRNGYAQVAFSELIW